MLSINRFYSYLKDIIGHPVDPTELKSNRLTYVLPTDQEFSKSRKKLILRPSSPDDDSFRPKPTAAVTSRDNTTVNKTFQETLNGEKVHEKCPKN